MATVYLARDLRHDRPVALKVLHPELAQSLGPERFQREIKLAARLDHPHILTVHDSGEAAGLLWYTMPYVERESLRDRLRREGQLPIHEAVRFAGEVADALDYAHRHGVVHRDVKPENILLGDGHARVADFGVARALEAAGGGQLTESGMAVGTPAYMSPEQASGAGQVDARTDIYALGCVLYEMLSGEPPFTGPTPQAVIARRLTESPRPLRATRERVTAHIQEAVGRALARAPADRFQSAAEFARALNAGHGSEPGTATISAARESGSRPKVWRRMVFVLGVLVTATLGLLLWQRSDQLTVAARGSPTARSEAGVPTRSPLTNTPSVAVLPFANLSPDPANEYFSDGMTEEIITALSRVEGLRVAARTSAFAFKGRNADVREIGHALNVATVLEGSVRRAGQRLRVTAQLINIADGYHLWADQYDRELQDVFQVQDDLARAIVGALRVPLKLTNRSDTALVTVGTVDPAAHDLYLQGRFFWNQRTYESLRTAVRYFERAIERDSSYAEAYAALADAYVVFPAYYVSAPAQGYPKAKAAALRALALDSTLAYAHATLGVVRGLYEWDWRGAERDFRRAITLDPSYATAHQWYAEYLSSLGRHQEALAEAERAATLDPLSRVISVDKAGVLIRARRYDEAVTELRSTLDFDPSFPPAHNYLAWAYLVKKMHVEAVAEAETAVRMGGRSFGMGRLAYAYALSGQRDSALQVIRQLTDRLRHENVASFQFALAYLGLGETDQAFAWLEKSAEMREPSLVLSILDPLFDSLRGDPRFTRLLIKMGLS